jgi:hypothetical protein
MKNALGYKFEKKKKETTDESMQEKSSNLQD